MDSAHLQGDGEIAHGVDHNHAAFEGGMKLKPITYRIATVSNWSGLLETRVHGYAVDCDLPAKFCVRKDGSYWVADEFTTGFGLDVTEATRNDAIEAAYLKIKYNINTGVYAAKMKKARRTIARLMA